MERCGISREPIKSPHTAAAPEKLTSRRSILENLDIDKQTGLSALAAYVKHDVPGFQEADLGAAVAKLAERGLVHSGINVDTDETGVVREVAGTEALKALKAEERKEGYTTAPKPQGCTAAPKPQAQDLLSGRGAVLPDQPEASADPPPDCGRRCGAGQDAGRRSPRAKPKRSANRVPLPCNRGCRNPRRRASIPTI